MTRSREQVCTFHVCILVLLLLIPAAPVRANVGPPSYGGQVAAEPLGVIKDITITHETLQIDMRPVAEGKRAQVEAIYHLDNRGPGQELDLLFASGSKTVSSFQVWLGEQPISSAPAPEMTTLPESWKPPHNTPGIEADRDLEYAARRKQVTPVGFKVVIPSGSQVLKVRYEAETGTYLPNTPTKYHQFAYVLAPARAWSGFGGLDVTVQVPAGWEAASVPKLDRDGDTLAGHFSELPPFDSLGLTIRAPAGPFYQPLVYGSFGLFWLVVLGGAFYCGWSGRCVGRARAQQEQGSASAQVSIGVLAFGLGLLWSVAVLLAGLFAVFGPEWVLPTEQVSHYGYGQATAVLGVIFLSVVVLPVGFLLALTTILLNRKRTAARENAWAARE